MSQLAEKIKSQPVNQTSFAFKAWITTLTFVFLVGAYFIVERLVLGLEVSSLTNTTPWGAWIAFYIFFIGLSAGSYLVSSLVYVFGMEEYKEIGKIALFTAIVCMIVGLTFVLMDLGKPERLLNSIIYWNVTSPLAWEIHFYLIYIVLLFVELYIAMREDLLRAKSHPGLKGRLAKWMTFKNATINDFTKKRDQRWMKILGTIGIPLAVFGVLGGESTLFAVVKARIAWNTAIFPVILLVSALLSGTALLLVMYIIKNKVQKKPVHQEMVISLSKLMIGFLVLDLGLQCYEYFIGWYSLEQDHLNLYKVMFTGTHAWSFWLVQLFIGSLIPLVLIFWNKTNKSMTAILISSICIVIGVIGVRFNIVVPALIIPLFGTMSEGQYFPTLNEWFVSLGVVAMGLLIYSFGSKYLPIDDVQNEEVR